MSLWNDSFLQNTNEIISEVSVLDSKKWSNQKDKGIMLNMNLSFYNYNIVWLSVYDN